MTIRAVTIENVYSIYICMFDNGTYLMYWSLLQCKFAILFVITLKLVKSEEVSIYKNTWEDKILKNN